MNKFQPGDRVRRIKSSVRAGPQVGQLGTVIEWPGIMSDQVWVRFDEMICSPSDLRDCYSWPCFVELIELVDPEPEEELVPINLEEVL